MPDESENTEQQPTRVPLNDLFSLLGQKELELDLLRKENGRLNQIVQNLRVALAKKQEEEKPDVVSEKQKDRARETGKSGDQS